MIKLELSEGINSKEFRSLEFEEFTFPDGTPHINIKRLPNNDCEAIFVYIRIKSFLDFGRLAIAIDVIKELYPYCSYYLVLPYFPGSRQDRRTSINEPFTAEVYANLLKSLGFRKIISLDKHSELTDKILNDTGFIASKQIRDFYSEALSDFENGSYIISPDLGSRERAQKVADRLICKTALGSKVRDPKTGELSGFDIDVEDFKGKDCYIIDDCCDNGGTFIGLANVMKERGCGNIHLIVTHATFPGGFKKLAKVFKTITCTNSIYTKVPVEDEKGSEILRILKLSEVCRL